MKKLFLLAVIFLGVVAANAQSLEEIVKKYTIANKLDKIAGLQTIKINATMSMAGREFPAEMWMKNPNKFKTITDFGGQKMVQSFDGVNGFTINPMMGSTEPVAMDAAAVEQMGRDNAFNNYIDDFLKKGKLSLEGEEAVNGNPAFKIKANVDAETVLFIFIDKGSYLIVKTSGTVNNQGQEILLESVPSDFKETNGVFMPMKTTISLGVMKFVTTVTSVEVNIPMEDSIFTLK